MAVNRVDQAVFDWFQSHQNDWLWYFFRDVTALGGATVATMVGILAVVILVHVGRWQQAMLFAGAFLITVLAVSVLKVVIARPRPLPYDPDLHHGEMMLFPAVPHLGSMPSGHTAQAAVLWGMLALMAGEVFASCRRLLAVASLILVLLVGLSRVYISAHWLTDVLVSYVLAAVILLGWRRRTAGGGA